MKENEDYQQIKKASTSMITMNSRNIRKHVKTLLLNRQILSYLASYIIILLISSYSIYTTLLINLILIINFIKLILNNTEQNINNKNLNYFVYSLLIGNYAVFQIMVYSYKEILAWELGLLILFNFLFIYYLYQLKSLKLNSSSVNHFNRFLQSSKSQSSGTKLFSCKLLDVTFSLNDATQAFMYMKCVGLIIAISVYTAQLTFTTICTPIMLFDWLLVPNKCFHIYDEWYVSICSACGFFCLNLAIITAIYSWLQIKKIYTLINY